MEENKQQRFNRLINECKSILDELNIKYNSNCNIIFDKLTNYFGETQRKYINNCIVYNIIINEKLLDDSIEDIKIKNIILHELLHTVPLCYGHSIFWQNLAKLINSNYKEYNIKQRYSTKEIGFNIIRQETHGQLFKQ